MACVRKVAWDTDQSSELRSGVDLLQGVEKSVRAAEINDAVNHDRRRVNSPDPNLLIVCHERRFTPVGMIKKGHIEPPIAGKHPTVVLLGLLDLKILEQIASFCVARFQRPVQHADENDIAGDCGRGKHPCFSLLAHDGLAIVCVNDVIQT